MKSRIVKIFKTKKNILNFVYWGDDPSNKTPAIVICDKKFKNAHLNALNTMVRIEHSNPAVKLENHVGTLFDPSLLLKITKILD
jgi:hypothetical protein